MLVFKADWCAHCALMDETTFNDYQVARYLEKTYVPFKVDIEEDCGYSLKQQYNIKTLPTFLIFDSQGKMVARYEEAMGAARFLCKAQKFDTPENRLKAVTLKQDFNNIKSKELSVTPLEYLEK